MSAPRERDAHGRAMMAGSDDEAKGGIRDGAKSESNDEAKGGIR